MVEMILVDSKLTKGTLAFSIQMLIFSVLRWTLFSKLRIFKQIKDPFFKKIKDIQKSQK